MITQRPVRVADLNLVSTRYHHIGAKILTLRLSGSDFRTLYQLTTSKTSWAVHTGFFFFFLYLIKSLQFSPYQNHLIFLFEIHSLYILLNMFLAFRSLLFSLILRYFLLNGLITWFYNTTHIFKGICIPN